jgi:hypothetical protein
LYQHIFNHWVAYVHNFIVGLGTHISWYPVSYFENTMYVYVCCGYELLKESTGESDDNEIRWKTRCYCFVWMSMIIA